MVLYRRVVGSVDRCCFCYSGRVLILVSRGYFFLRGLKIYVFVVGIRVGLSEGFSWFS